MRVNLVSLNFGIVLKTVLSISKGKAPPHPMFHTFKKIAQHHSTACSKDFVIHPHMTEISQNKVDTLTSGHPVVEFRSLRDKTSIMSIC